MKNRTKSEGTSSQNRMLRAGAGYIIGNYLLKGITFLSAPIFTRLLSTEEYGDFGAYYSYEAIFYIILGLALHSSITNAKYEYKEKFSQYISSLVLLVILSTGFWLVSANLLYNRFGNRLGFSRTIINLMLLHCFGSAMIQFFNTYVSLDYRVKSYLRLTSFNALSNMGLSIVLILTIFSEDRLTGRILGTVLPILAISIYICCYFFRKSRPVVNQSYWRYGLHYSLPIIPHGISQVILSSFDRIMIKKIIGSTEAGLYNFAGTINSIIVVVSTSLDNVWKPWFYEQMEKKDDASIRKYAGKYMFGFAGFVAMVLMVTPEIIKIFGDRSYWGTTSCIVPVVIGGFFSFIYTIPVYVEYYYKKTKYIAVGSASAAALNILLNYIFIPRSGYIAAAYTTLITYAFYYLFHFLLAKKIHGSNLVPIPELLCSVLLVSIAGGLTVFLEHRLLLRWSIEVVLGLFGLAWAEQNFGLKAAVKKCGRGIKG